MFERKIKKDYLKLAKIVYGGEFYLELKNYRLKEVKNSKFIKDFDSLLGKQGNNNFYAYKNYESGFSGNVFDNGKVLVLAYRGTERLGLGENVSDINAFMADVMTDINLISGYFDKQFKDAWDFYKEVKKENPKRKIVIVGQSLGGALAQIVSAKEYTVNRIKLETYTFNAPGCTHLLETYDCNLDYDYPFITNYSVMNDWCGMFGEHIGKRYLIRPIEIPASQTNSTEEIINNVLLKTHEGIFDYDEKLMGKIIRKPKDFNQNEGLSLWYFDENNPWKEIPKSADSQQENENPLQMDLANNKFIIKAQQFLANNDSDEEQNSSVIVSIKNAASNFITNSIEQINKMTESINNNTFAVAMRIADSIFDELSLESLEKAKKIVERIEKK